MEETNQIKPIETIYKGYRFRSRLEARWAVFFDAAEIPFEYEPEGYSLTSGYYLPDFLLLASDFPKFLEIKAIVPTLKERRLAYELCHYIKHTVRIISGPPWNFMKHFHAFYQTPFEECFNSEEDNSHVDIVRKQACEFDVDTINYNGEETVKELSILPIFEETMLKAKQARFEYGETPQ